MRKKWPAGLEKEIFDKTSGKCYHCNKKLVFNHRKKTDGRGAWNMDHYPVVYRDIEDQICCGITNQHDPNNIVAACVDCNKSHKHEKKYWCYCGDSQFPCKKKFFIKLYLILIHVLILFLLLNLIIKII